MEDGKRNQIFSFIPNAFIYLGSECFITLRGSTDLYDDLTRPKGVKGNGRMKCFFSIGNSFIFLGNSPSRK